MENEEEDENERGSGERCRQNRDLQLQQQQESDDGADGGENDDDVVFVSRREGSSSRDERGAGSGGGLGYDVDVDNSEKDRRVVLLLDLDWYEESSLAAPFFDSFPFFDSSQSSFFSFLPLFVSHSFYAQCECVRLGYDASVTPLALLQWNSVLAVTYPARTRFGIQRGDTWEAVHSKSDGRCLAVHVPVLSASSVAATGATAKQQPNDDPRQSAVDEGDAAADNTDDEYSTIFSLSDRQREEARRTDLGVRKFSNDNKSCIERYRVASGKIFEAVLEWIRCRGGGGSGSGGIVLERASIDEFFLDVTAHCARFNGDDGDSARSSNAAFFRTGTVVIGDCDKASSEKRGTVRDDRQPEEEDDDDNDEMNDCVALQLIPEEEELLRWGCCVAHDIRRHVFQKLGFTLSAGISWNKTVAKLSAAYGKPNGQAVTLPRHIRHLLNETLISKCRNLGGKLGARVQALLPPGVPATVGSIERYLTLADLQRRLDIDTSKWVYDLSRGVDREVVAEKEAGSALVKSITAFKNLNGRMLSVDECASQWIPLLAWEIVDRVEKDTARNRRYPRTVNVNYSVAIENGHPNDQRRRGGRSASVRANFPPERMSTEDKIQDLVDRVPKLVQGKEGKSARLTGIGICAVDFVTRVKRGQAIDSFFKVADSTASCAEMGKSQDGGRKPDKSMNTKGGETTEFHADLELAKRLQKAYDGENRIGRATSAAKTRAMQRQRRQSDEDDAGGSKKEADDPDLALAKRLQADYDREQWVLQKVGEHRRHRPQQERRAPKTRRIDSFFKQK